MLDRALEKAARNEKKIVFITKRNSRDISFLNELYDFDIVYVKNLHTKLYLNEKEALVSSMNLYDYSQTNNYELGVYFNNPYDVKQLKEKIIEGDLLSLADDSIVPGRYFRDIAALNNRNDKIENQNTGHCIRCGNSIPFDCSRPYCLSCWQKWMEYGGQENRMEHFCHKCGKAVRGISINSPLCSDDTF